MELSDFFRQHPTGAVAFSGGVDSSLLVWWFLCQHLS